MIIHKQKQKGFTLAEILLAFFIIGIIASVVIPISIAKIDSAANAYMTYSTFNAIQSAFSEYKRRNSSAVFDTTTMPYTVLYSELNTIGTTDSTAIVASAPSATDTPIMTLSNGARVYYQDYDGSKHTIYIDIDGKNRRRSTLNDDVIAFIITSDGRFYPEKDSQAANNTGYLSVNYGYWAGETYTEIENSVSYKNATCKSGIITDTTYCDTITIDPNCDPATSNVCTININKPIGLR